MIVTLYRRDGTTLTSDENDRYVPARVIRLGGVYGVLGADNPPQYEEASFEDLDARASQQQGPIP